MPRKGWRKPRLADENDPDGLTVWARRHLERLEVQGYSPRGLKSRECFLLIFVDWAMTQDVTEPRHVSRGVLERYASHCFHHRESGKGSLLAGTQRKRLQVIKIFFQWLYKQGVVPEDPAATLELPRTGRRLPRAVLTESEVERVLRLPDTTTNLGLRDRTLMEVAYATGLRRLELTRLRVYDVDHSRRSVTVRQGKGRKDRVVPVSKRALRWVSKYVDEARPELAVLPDAGFLFLSSRGKPLDPTYTSNFMAKYIRSSGVGKPGAVHIFRHTMATLMLENGADIRVIAELLGHSEISTTQIYTRVSAKHLQAVYTQTHPGARE
jgi:integrase/recombinase XerD